MKIRSLLLFATALVVAGCAAPPTPVVAPQAEARPFIDPRVGWSGTPDRGVERRFEVAWQDFLAGDFPGARAQLAEVTGRQADYLPATLLSAAIDIRQRDFAGAHAILDPLLVRNPQYTAAAVYAAELDVAENHIESAWNRYRELLGRTQVPASVSARYAELQTRLFNELYAGAIDAPPPQAIPLLRQALTVTPSASAARLLLVQKLIAARQFDDANKELNPMLNTSAADQPETQEALAEIDIGRGHYQDAINRYERLARRDATGRYSRRLEEIKEQFAAENMPPQIVAAMNAPTITRADLAVLAYWDVASIRFAQNVPAPPIAIDIADGPGRDEMVRAIALGIFSVDPITRRVYPDQVVTGGALARIAARILTLRGASCAKQVPAAGGPDAILSACGLDPPDAGPAADAPVSGQAAAALLAQVDQAISR